MAEEIRLSLLTDEGEIALGKNDIGIVLRQDGTVVLYMSEDQKKLKNKPIIVQTAMAICNGILSEEPIPIVIELTKKLEEDIKNNRGVFGDTDG